MYLSAIRSLQNSAWQRLRNNFHLTRFLIQTQRNIWFMTSSCIVVHAPVCTLNHNTMYRYLKVLKKKNMKKLSSDCWLRKFWLPSLKISGWLLWVLSPSTFLCLWRLRRCFRFGTCNPIYTASVDLWSVELNKNSL